MLFMTPAFAMLTHASEVLIVSSELIIFYENL